MHNNKLLGILLLIVAIGAVIFSLYFYKSNSKKRLYEMSERRVEKLGDLFSDYLERENKIPFRIEDLIEDVHSNHGLEDTVIFSPRFNNKYIYAFKGRTINKNQWEIITLQKDSLLNNEYIVFYENITGQDTRMALAYVFNYGIRRFHESHLIDLLKYQNIELKKLRAHRE